MNLIPYINEKNEFCDGLCIKALSFCKEHYNMGKCKNFYNSLKNIDYNKFLSCPYGLSVYLKVYEGDIYRVIGLREEKTFDNKKHKQIKTSKDNVFNPKLSSNQLIEMIDTSFLLMENKKQLDEKYVEIQSIAHEVKQLNAQISEHADMIIHEYGEKELTCMTQEDIDNILDGIKSIYASSKLIYIRYSILDYSRNRNTLIKESKIRCGVYKKFDKIRLIFKNYMGKKIPICISGESYTEIDAYPVFEMIPVLLIENAIKYSYDNTNPVQINFKENETKLEVSIISYSVLCDKYEKNKIFRKGYRGSYAKKVALGSGLGLYFVKLICDLHNIDIDIIIGNKGISNIEGVSYGTFEVKLIFKKESCI